MPRNRIDLDTYKDQIIAHWTNGASVDRIREILQKEEGIDIGHQTLARRLKQWDAPRKRVRMDFAEQQEEEVRDRIHYLYFQEKRKDSEILEDLRSKGYPVNCMRSVQRLRRKYGLVRRVPREDFEAQEQMTFDVVKEALEASNLDERPLRKVVFDSLRSQGYNLMRDRTFRAVKQLSNQRWGEQSRHMGGRNRRKAAAAARAARSSNVFETPYAEQGPPGYEQPL